MSSLPEKTAAPRAKTAVTMPRSTPQARMRTAPTAEARSAALRATRARPWPRLRHSSCSMAKKAVTTLAITDATEPARKTLR